MAQLAFYVDCKLFARVKLADELVIGRSAECDVQLAHPGISPRHLRIREREDGSAWIENLSPESARLNARALVGRSELAAGDRIYIRDYMLMYQPEEAASATPVSSPSRATAEPEVEIVTAG